MNYRQDLTQGKIWKRLLTYFIPICAGTLFQQLYNAVDAFVVGKYVGTNALAAVGGSPATLSNLLIGFFVALSGGAGVVIAQHYGAREREEVSKEIHTSITFCFFVGIIISLLVCFFAPFILNILRTPTETFEDAVLYTRVYFAGSVFMLLFNMASGILRAMGNSRRPFVYLAISCITNIGLDLYFVLVLNMGVAGVAWATVIAQALSMVLSILDLFRMEGSYRLKFSKLGIDWKTLADMLRIGIPAGITSAMYGFSNLILQVGVNSLGTTVVASWSMSGKIDGLYWAVSDAFGVAITNFVGQNYGAKRFDRVKKCPKVGLILFTALTVMISGLILTIARPLLHVFTDDLAVVETTWTIITYFVPYYFSWTVVNIFSGVLRGVGDAIKPTIITGMCVCVFRMIWVVTIFQMYHTLLGISACYPISWVLTDIVLIIYYFKGSIFSKKHEKELC